MRWTSPLSVVAIAACTTTIARADDGSSPWLLIPGQLSANTTGTADAKVGVGAIRALGTSTDGYAILDIRTKTDSGLANLFQVQHNETTDTTSFAETQPWQAGITLGLMFLETSTPTDVRVDQAITAAVAICEAENACTNPASNKSYCDLRLSIGEAWAQRAYVSLPPEQVCTAVRKSVSDIDADHAANHTSDADWRKRRETALSKCADTCLGTDVSGEDAAFCAQHFGFRAVDFARSFSRPTLCADGQDAYDKGLGQLHVPPPRHYPVLQVRAGGTLGRSSFSYYAADGTNPSVLTKQKSSEWTGKAGTGATFLPLRGTIAPSFEGLVLGSWDATAPTDTVHFCQDTAPVQVNMKTTVPGQNCTTATLGPPTTPATFSMAFRVGVFDGHRDAWRAAFGPFYQYSNGKERHTAQLQAPFYISIASLTSATLDYKGLVRIAPSVGVVVLDDGSHSFRGIIELAILGQRSLFGDTFDEL